MGSSTIQARETMGVPAPRPMGTGEAPGGVPLVQKLAEQLIERWRWGERPLAEEYLERYPELRAQPEAAIELIYEEICLRREYGLASATADVLERFPEWRAQLQVLLDCHELLEQPPPAFQLPNAGASLGDFQLLAELGRGARGRVFLATQPSLAGRPVVVKVTPREGGEHLSLGRLQHTHIVPLYSVQDHPESHLRALCMPYFGGATLAYLLGALRDVPPAKRSANDLLGALDRAPSRSLLAIPAEGPARRSLSGASYVQAICWIGACLADALHYAQERNLIHLDLKPSNVLLAADGQPMLLDFHLACEPIHPGAPLPEWLGGTPAYMSPEQQLALAAVRAGQGVPQSVDGRSDIYSLGLVLYEALGANLPAPQAGAGEELRRCNPQVSLGLADVLEKCLVHEAQSRYQSAADLAGDLRRHLADQPLKGVANRNFAERWRKWRRRRPHTLTFACILSAAIVLTVFGLNQVQQRASDARQALLEGQKQLEEGRYVEAAGSLYHGLTLARDLPWHAELKEDLQTAFDRADPARCALEVHARAEIIRRGLSEESPGRWKLDALETRCRELWDSRQTFSGRARSTLSPRLQEQLVQDFLDVAILWGDLRVRLAAPEEADAKRRDVLQLFIWAEGIFGPTPVLDREYQTHAEALGRMEIAQAAARRVAEHPPRSAWEHCALGRALWRAGNPAQAAEALDRALALEPQSLWANFYKGKCAYQLQRYDDAVLAFTACAVLAPQDARPFCDRALAYTALDRLDKALLDYDHAIGLDPTMANALVNRGILHYQARRYAEALRDLQAGLTQGADAALVHYNLGLVHQAQGDKAAALASAAKALEADPTHKQALELQSRLKP
jgi:serine/threonine protein kinase/tetratricopeptide (TPR) repeat protein